METKEKKVVKPIVVEEENYVIFDGKKMSRTWAAMLANKSNPGIKIIDMRAVLK